MGVGSLWEMKLPTTFQVGGQVGSGETQFQDPVGNEVDMNTRGSKPCPPGEKGDLDPSISC